MSSASNVLVISVADDDGDEDASRSRAMVNSLQATTLRYDIDEDTLVNALIEHQQVLVCN